MHARLCFVESSLIPPHFFCSIVGVDCFIYSTSLLLLGKLVWAILIISLRSQQQVVSITSGQTDGRIQRPIKRQLLKQLC